jgi:hypothetical protein
MIAMIRVNGNHTDVVRMPDFTSIIPPEALSTMVAVAALTPPGAWVEVGVYRGGSALRLYAIATAQHRQLHLFDTFTGTPFAGPHDRHQVGDFADTNLDAMKKVMPRAAFYPGIFPATFNALEVGPLAFAHVDCDQYASVRDSIVTLWPLLVKNGVLWFDDFSDLKGARIAAMEQFSEAELEWAPCGRRFVRKPPFAGTPPPLERRPA